MNAKISASKNVFPLIEYTLLKESGYQMHTWYYIVQRWMAH